MIEEYKELKKLETFNDWLKNRKLVAKLSDLPDIAVCEHKNKKYPIFFFGTVCIPWNIAIVYIQRNVFGIYTARPLYEHVEEFVKQWNEHISPVQIKMLNRKLATLQTNILNIEAKMSERDMAIENIKFIEETYMKQWNNPEKIC